MYFHLGNHSLKHEASFFLSTKLLHIFAYLTPTTLYQRIEGWSTLKHTKQCVKSNVEGQVQLQLTARTRHISSLLTVRRAFANYLRTTPSKILSSARRKYTHEMLTREATEDISELIKQR